MQHICMYVYYSIPSINMYTAILESTNNYCVLPAGKYILYCIGMDLTYSIVHMPSTVMLIYPAAITYMYCES